MLSRLAFSYMWSYNNIDFNMETNGEFAIIDRLFNTPPKVLFDVGANIGKWSSKVCERFPLAQLHSFEIAPAVHALLQRRLQNTNVVINGFGLSDQIKTLKLKYHPDRNELSSLHIDATHFPFAWEIIDAQVTTGDAYCRQYGVESIDFLKIDTEGHDLSVLRGFSEMLAQNKIVAIQFEYNEMAIFSRTYLRDFYELLSERYEIGRILPMGAAFKNYVPMDENFLPANFLAIAKTRPELTERMRFPA